jgi:hypothetical protein
MYDETFDDGAEHMTIRAKVTAGALSQIFAQILTGFALVVHLFDWSNASVWVAVPLGAAMLVPFRHDGSLHDRAIGNFGAASVVAGMFAWELMLGGVEGILGGTGGSVAGPFTLLTLAAAVLFSGAGAAFWILKENRAT